MAANACLALCMGKWEKTRKAQPSLEALLLAAHGSEWNMAMTERPCPEKNRAPVALRLLPCARRGQATDHIMAASPTAQQ